MAFSKGSNFSKTDRALQIVIVSGLVLVFALILFNLLGPNQNSLTLTPLKTAVLSEQSLPTALPVSEIIVSGLPTRLRIAKLNVDAGVLGVGLTTLGLMDTPKGPDDVGWYMTGTRPGDIGSAVITGHFGWKDGRAAVFDNLSDLLAGDLLSIEDETGRIITFLVSGQKTYGPDDDAADVFTSNDGKSHLNLVTCQGVWNANNKSYSERLVVFADKVVE